MYAKQMKRRFLRPALDGTSAVHRIAVSDAMNRAKADIFWGKLDETRLADFFHGLGKFYIVDIGHRVKTKALGGEF